MTGHVVQLGVVTHEDICQRRCEYLRQYHHYHAAHAHYRHALAQHVLQLVIIGRAVMIADYRRRTYRIAYEYGHEYELNIHEHAIRRNTVFSREFNQLEVIQRAHNRAGYIRHKLGCAVRTRLQ